VLAVSRWIERQTGWSIRKFVKTARRYRDIEIRAGPHTITPADPIPEHLRQASKRSATPADLCTKLNQIGTSYMVVPRWADSVAVTPSLVKKLR